MPLMSGEFEDVDISRALLTTASVRFTPGTQNIKGTALEKVVERLFGLEEKDAFSVDELQTNFRSLSNYTLDLREIRDTVERLEKKGRVIPTEKEQGKTRYRLSPEALNEVGNTRKEASRRLTKVLEELVDRENVDTNKYIEPFLVSLTLVFSNLGEEYARELTDDSVGSIDQQIGFEEITEQANQKYDIEVSILQHALERFFEVKDPTYDHIKWNMAQNYFVMKALGFEDNLWRLFEEKFGDSVFYLDTNLIIGALEAEHRLHDSVVALAETCDRLDIDLRVSNISLGEFNRWKQFQKHTFEKIQDVLPGGMIDEVDSVIYEKYDKALGSKEGSVDIEELFASFSEPKDKLAASFGIEVKDDSWFVKTKSEREFDGCRAHLKSLKYNKKNVAAEHDALMLLWVLKLRKVEKQDAWFITADKSLPGADLPCVQESPDESLALLSEAILHWVLPMQENGPGERGFAKGFAACIKERLLPQEKLFQLEDFAIFADIDRSVKDLPKRDAKECLQYLKSEVTGLDPSVPEDREKINAEMTRFLERPEREYKKQLKRAEDEKDKLKNDLKEVDSKRLRGSGLARLALVVFMLVIVEGGLVFLASRYGQGENIYQKIVSWPLWYSLTGTGVLTLGSKFIIGRERLKAIGLWRNSSD